MKFMKFWCNFFDVEQSNKKERQAAFLACSLALAVREPERAPALFFVCLKILSPKSTCRDF
jgi:hypothetical protein